MSTENNPTGSQAAVDAGVAENTDLNAIENDAVKGITGEGVSQDDLDSMDAAELDAAEKNGDITKKQAASLKKKLKLKVHGQEIEEEYDLGDEELLKREFQKAKAFDKTSKDFAEQQKQVQQLMNLLKESPEKVLAHLGLDVDGWAETHLTKKLEQMKKSPEQLEREKMAAELETLRKEKQAIEDARKQAEQERLKGQAMIQINEEIKKAMTDSKSFLPQKPKIMQRVAETMVFAMQNGFPEVTAKDIIPIVEKQWKAEMNDYFSEAPEDFIENLVGKDPLTRYRKSIVSKNKAVAQVPDKRVVDTGKVAPKEEEAMSEAEQKKRFRELFRM